MKALSCIYKNLVREKLSKFSQLPFCQKLFFLNQTTSCICSMCLYCIGKVSNCSIKSCGRSWSAHEGTIYAYSKALLGKNCLSSHSCHFVKNYLFEPNSFMHMFNVSTLYRQSINLFHLKLWYELIGPWRHYHAYTKALLGKNCLSSHSWHYHAYTKALLGKNCLSSHSCHYIKNYFFWIKLLHAYVQCVYIV